MPQINLQTKKRGRERGGREGERREGGREEGGREGERREGERREGMLAVATCNITHYIPHLLFSPLSPHRSKYSVVSLSIQGT